MKKNYKKYHPDTLNKDFTIGFYAGIAGGATVLFLSYILKFVIEENYGMLVKGVIAYVSIGIIFYYLFNWILIKTYGKTK